MCEECVGNGAIVYACNVGNKQVICELCNVATIIGHNLVGHKAILYRSFVFANNTTKCQTDVLVISTKI